MNRAPGTYVLIVELDRRRRVRVGRLGVIPFEPGFYAYVGSAMGGLESRIARHLRQPQFKRPHWHVDHLLAAARIQAVFIWPGSERAECLTAQMLAKQFAGTARFGCSDCRCRSHLFFSPKANGIVTRLQSEPLWFVPHDTALIA